MLINSFITINISLRDHKTLSPIIRAIALHTKLFIDEFNILDVRDVFLIVKRSKYDAMLRRFYLNIVIRQNIVSILEHRKLEVTRVSIEIHYGDYLDFTRRRVDDNDIFSTMSDTTRREGHCLHLSKIDIITLTKALTIRSDNCTSLSFMFCKSFIKKDYIQKCESKEHGW